MINKNELELYIHIPFCVRKCNYCDFLSFAADEETKARYVDALVSEIRAEGQKYAGRKVISVYIGGGTPSVLSEDQTAKIMEAVRTSFDLSDFGKKRLLDNELTDMNFKAGEEDVPPVRKKRSLFERIKGKPKLPAIEISMECNPGTLTPEKLKRYKQIGINRLSIGLQSAIPEELEALGRIHGIKDFLESFDMARDAGFANINVDLMQAVPHQTPASWKKSLLMTAALRPEHISAYSLIIEEGTPFYDQMNTKSSGFEKLLPDEDAEREIYHITKELLDSAGYNRYEISNYALPGYECRHNCGYWQRRNYLGLGLGAASLIDGSRWKNTAEMETFLQTFENGRAAEEIYTEQEKLSLNDCMEEYMFLGLRMANGVSKEEFMSEFGTSYDLVYGAVTEHMQMQGLMDERKLDLINGGQETRVFLTPRGVDVSNTVMAEFMLDE